MKKTYILEVILKIGVIKVAPIKRAAFLHQSRTATWLKVLKENWRLVEVWFYTATLNPAIDHIVRLDHVEHRSGQRDGSVKINSPVVRESMSVVSLKRPDIEKHSDWIIGGFTGRFIEDVLTREAISTNFDSGPRYTDQCQNQSRWGNRDHRNGPEGDGNSGQELPTSYRA